MAIIDFKKLLSDDENNRFKVYKNTSFRDLRNQLEKSGRLGKARDFFNKQEQERQNTALQERINTKVNETQNLISKQKTGWLEKGANFFGKTFEGTFLGDKKEKELQSKIDENIAINNELTKQYLQVKDPNVKNRLKAEIQSNLRMNDALLGNTRVERDDEAERQRREDLGEEGRKREYFYKQRFEEERIKVDPNANVFKRTLQKAGSKIQGGVNKLMPSITETAIDLKQEEYDKKNLAKIEQNNSKIIELSRKKNKTFLDENEIKVLIDENNKLIEMAGGIIKDKTNRELVGQSLSTATDVSNFIPVGTIASAGLKGVEKVGAKFLGGNALKLMTKDFAKVEGKKAIAGKLFNYFGENATLGGLQGMGEAIKNPNATKEDILSEFGRSAGLSVATDTIFSGILKGLGKLMPNVEKSGVLKAVDTNEVLDAVKKEVPDLTLQETEQIVKRIEEKKAGIEHTNINEIADNIQKNEQIDGIKAETPEVKQEETPNLETPKIQGETPKVETLKSAKVSDTETPQLPKEQMTGEATWKSKDGEKPVKVVNYAGELNGKKYLNVEGMESPVLADEIEFKGAKSEMPSKVIKEEVKTPKITDLELEKKKTDDIINKEKVSKVAKSIEQKMIDKGYIDAGEKIEKATFQSRNIKEQAKISAEILRDTERVKRIVNGEENVPDNLSPTFFGKAVEDYAMENNDVDLIRKLANSNLISRGSEAASDLRMLAERDPDSVTIKLMEIKKKKKEVVKKLLENSGITIEKETKNVKETIKEKIKKIKKPSWDEFINEIKCK